MKHVSDIRTVSIIGTMLLIHLLLVATVAGDAWEVFGIEEGFTRRPTWACATGGKAIYLSRSDGTVLLFDGRTFQELEGTREMLGETQIKNLLVDGPRLWIGTGKGLFLYHQSSLSCLTSRGGLDIDQVRDVQVDQSKNVWVLGEKNIARGTWFGDRLVWTSFPLWSGWIKPFEPKDLLIDREQRVWVATSDGVLLLAQDGSSQRLGPASGLQWAKTTCLAEGGDSSLWVGAHDHFGRGTVYKMSDGRFQDVGTGFGLPRVQIRALTVDGQVVWAATSQGLYKFDGNRWHQYSRRDGLAQDDIDAVLTTSEAVYARTVSRYASELNRLSKMVE